MNDQRFTMQEAADFLGCSKSFIQKSTTDGTLAHLRLGRRFYYLKADLLTLIKRVEPHNVPIDSIE